MSDLVYDIITDKNRKKTILEKLVSEKNQLRFWIPPEDPVYLSPKHGNVDTITCDVEAAKANIFTQKDSFKFNFDLNNDEYMFEAKVRVENNEVILFPKEDLFLVQKRKEYRYNIPDTFATHINIISISNIECNFTGRLQNVTNYGCRSIFTKDSVHVKVGQALVANLSLGTQDPIKLAGLIKGIHEDQKNTYVSIEFNHLGFDSEDLLNTALILMQRELFIQSQG